jgi:hypothetical protein
MISSVLNIQNTIFPVYIKSCADKRIKNRMLIYAMVQTFKSGFLFDDTIKILKKTNFTYPYSEQRKNILSSVYFKECNLFAFFKTIVLSFPDFWFIDKCVTIRGDFIFASSIYYWKNTLLTKHAINTCNDAHCLLNNNTNKYIHQKNTTKRYNLENYVFNIVYNNSKNFTSRECPYYDYEQHKNAHYDYVDIYLTRYDNKTKSNKIQCRNLPCSNKCDNKIFYIKCDYNDLNYHNNCCCDYYNQYYNMFFHDYTYDYDAIFSKHNYDETYCYSKKIKNNKEINTKKWSPRKKIIKYYHGQNKNSKKSRKIISTYKSACL